MCKLETLNTVDEVIDRLGGNAAVQEKVGLKSMQAVWAWRNRGQIATRMYLLMTDDLRALGCRAPAALWGMRESGGGHA